MPSVCLYFQIHQPPRLRRYSVFDSEPTYFDDNTNAAIMHKVADKCYRPAMDILLELVNRYDGRFRFAFSVTGCALEQMREHAPDVIERLGQLAASDCVEFLSETYYHSLAFMYSRAEFKEQVDKHKALMQELFGQTPTVFRNTELIYSNDLAAYLRGMGGYGGIITEGADHILQRRSPNVIYHPPGASRLKLLLKNYKLSDDIAFRFSNRGWPDWPLTPEKFARWVDDTSSEGEVCNLFMDFETFGEHQWAETGIFDFLRDMPESLLLINDQANTFRTPSECVAAFDVTDEYDVPHMISWADTERDLSAWLGNAMQSNALHELYKLEQPVKQSGDAALLDDWRKLTCSDHYYYMCTKYFADGEVHKYFSPYESPYDSYINFMNVLDNLRTRVEQKEG